MGKRNDEFRQKYNKLDKLCRAKFNMFTNPDGTRNNLSAIKVYSDTLPEAQKNTLRNIISLRNLIEHNDYAEVNYNVIKDLDMFIALVEKKYSVKSKLPFELISYFNHNVPKMRAAIRELDLQDEEIPASDVQRIEEELNGYIDKLQKCDDLEKAKLIVRDFYSAIENIDEHPIFIQNDIKESRAEAIAQINDSLNDVLDELVNPFKKNKAKEIAKRYIEQIKQCDDVDRIEELADNATDSLDMI